MFSDIPIKYFNGTHRVKNPSETIENFEDKLRVAGITRITNITDLDRIGVPVFSAIRPTAQEGSVSIYAGKGIGESQAKASAMMEGFERYSAVEFLSAFMASLPSSQFAGQTSPCFCTWV